MFLSPHHKEGLAHLLYGIRVGGGFVALTGDVGTGKTTLCHCLLKQLPKDIDIALILNPKLNALELLATICDELGIPYNAEQLPLKSLVDALFKYLLEAHAQNRRTVLMLDEAQNLSFEALEQIRLLTNLETHKTKLLQIILVGQPELRDLLNRQDLRQLNQRITAKYHLQPLSKKQTREYIQHRLKVCGGDPKLFKNTAMRKIYKLTSGVPRLINILCDRALLGTYALNKTTVSGHIVIKAAKEVLPRQSNRLLGLLALFMATAVVIFSGWYFLPTDKPVAKIIPENVAVQATKVNTIKKKTVKQTAFVGPIKPDNLAEPAKTDLQQITPAPEIIATQASAAEQPPSLLAMLENPALDINAAILQSIEFWGYFYPSDEKIDCKSLQTLNLYCLYDKGEWNSLLEFNRPVIMEFLLPLGQIRYGFLTGIRTGQPVLRFNEDLSFPLDDVLSYWNGYYLLIWSPPVKHIRHIAPERTSASVLWLRSQLAKWDNNSESPKNPRYFDAALKSRVIKFQQQHQLFTDGVVGPRTILHLQNADEIFTFATLEMTE